MFNAGANRYLLRHETADEKHYGLLHPGEMSYKHRVQCLESLREVGFTVGCGFMVGSPFQTLENISSDLKFIEEFSPEMCGIALVVHCGGCMLNARELSGRLDNCEIEGVSVTNYGIAIAKMHGILERALSVFHICQV